jgi:hypothetical protein
MQVRGEREYLSEIQYAGLPVTRSAGQIQQIKQKCEKSYLSVYQWTGLPIKNKIFHLAVFGFQKK